MVAAITESPSIHESVLGQAIIDLGSGFDFRICVTHHPLFWLEPDNERVVTREIGAHFDIHLYGHPHIATPLQVVDPSGKHHSSQAGALSLFDAAGAPLATFAPASP